MMTLAPKTLALGDYDLIEKIAEGGMGSVYKGRKRGGEQIVAIKVLPPHLAKNPVLLKRFEQEYSAARAIDHANIVRALDFGRDGDSPYLVMEFVQGESLGQKIDREGRLTEHEAIRIIAQVAQGLRKAHKQGMVHRDVKPDNILITHEGQVKLTDLGLVKEIETDLNLTRTGRGLGTPHFMAPEQFRNAKKADARCDIYSLAATLYMMVTGELPFKMCGPLDAWMKKIQNEITPPRKLVPSLSDRVDWAIRRGMSADPAQRPATCREFIEDLTGHSTRRVKKGDDAELNGDRWFYAYRDAQGGLQTSKNTTEGIRRLLKEKRLGRADDVRVSRSEAGPFESLRQHAEFRDLVIEPTPLPTKSAPPLPPTNATPVPAAIQPPIPALCAPRENAGGDTSSLFVVALPPKQTTPRPVHVPHIDLGATSSGEEWTRWLIVLVMALATGVVGYFFTRWLGDGRLF